MACSKLNCAETDERLNGKAEDSNPFLTALEVFKLVKTHATPPFPNTYALWYSYVAGSNSSVTSEIDRMIAQRASLSPYDINQISQMYLQESDLEARQSEISKDIERGVERALALFDDGVENGAGFADTIGEISESLKDPESDHVELLDRLLMENEQMMHSSRELKQCIITTKEHIAELNAQLSDIREESSRDGLTLVANRKAFNEKLETEVICATDQSQNVCLAIADLDNFKTVNDTFGHQAGDEVLKAFAQLLVRSVKGQDTVARFGGEEFAIIMPRTTAFDAHNLMNRIRHRWEEESIAIRGDAAEIRGLTASFGISYLNDIDSAEDLIWRADKLLYAAKKSGRNTVKTEGFS